VTTEDGSTLVRGWQAGTMLQEGGWRPVWLGGKRSWAVDARHEGDVLAYLQTRGIGVVHTGPARVAAEAPDSSPIRSLIEDPTLFDGDDAA
jgi:hypothetical protein